MDSDSTKPKSSFRDVVNFLGGLVILGAFVVGVFQKCSSDDTPAKHGDTNVQRASGPEVLSTSISALVGAFEANEIRAAQLTEGKRVRFTGRIQELSLTAFNTPYLMLAEFQLAAPSVDEKDPLTSLFKAIAAMEMTAAPPTLAAHFESSSKAQLASWNKGQLIEVTCSNAGMNLGSVKVEDCSARMVQEPSTTKPPASANAKSTPQTLTANPVGTWIGETEGRQVLKVSGTHPNIKVSVDAEGASAGGGTCGGHVEGAATWNPETQTLVVSDARGDSTPERITEAICKVTVRFDGEAADLETEGVGCLAYVGACASLDSTSMVRK